MNHKTPRFFIVLSTLLVMMFVLAACSVRPLSRLWTPQHTATPQPTPHPLVVAAPEMDCPTLPATWLGIKPGQSTLTDVITLAGEPAIAYPTRAMMSKLYYSPISEAFRNDYETHTVSLRSDKTVDWIGLWVQDVDGSFHTVAEYVLQYGPFLDRVYQMGPDIGGLNYVYVWSHCGIAIEAVSPQVVKRTEEETLNIAPIAEVDAEELIPIPLFNESDFETFSTTRDPSKLDTTDMLVARAYMFEPTNYATFEEFYTELILTSIFENLYHHRFSEPTLDSEGETIK